MLTFDAISSLVEFAVHSWPRDRGTQGSKCSSLKMTHGKPDPWLQLTNPTLQFTISAISAHTAIRTTLNNSRARGPEMQNPDPPQHQPSLQTDLVEVEEQFPALGRFQGLFIGGAA